MPQQQNPRYRPNLLLSNKYDLHRVNQLPNGHFADYIITEEDPTSSLEPQITARYP